AQASSLSPDVQAASAGIRGISADVTLRAVRLSWNARFSSTVAEESLKNADSEVPPAVASTGGLSRPRRSRTELAYWWTESRHSRRPIGGSGVHGSLGSYAVGGLSVLLSPPSLQAIPLEKTVSTETKGRPARRRRSITTRTLMVSRRATRSAS